MGRIGPAVLLTITTYLVLAVVFGPRGIIAHRHRGAYHAALERNLERLDKRGDELRSEIERLQQDPDAITLAAREQLVLEPNERLVRVTDGTGNEVIPALGAGGGISPGSVLRRQQLYPDYSPVLRGVAASVGLAAYVFALGLKERPSNARRGSHGRGSHGRGSRGGEARAAQAPSRQPTRRPRGATARKVAAHLPESLSDTGTSGA